MTPGHEALLRQLAALSREAQPARRYVIAFSGGLDSTVLLHALTAQTIDLPVLAVHIDHGLHVDSSDWSARCAQVAESFGVEFRSIRTDIDSSQSQGLEAAARDARYNEFAELITAGDWLLSAHHQDDQAETLLLNLLRGSGPAGLAGIAAIRPFANGWLARPLLEYSRNDLQKYATKHDLDWVEDPSNAEQRFDRNFLRHSVMPQLEQRWPDAVRSLQRSGRLAGEAAALLDELAAIDAATLGERMDRIDIPALCKLSPERQRNVLRYALRELQLPTPTAKHLQLVLDEVVAARKDAEPVVNWPGVAVRRYRDCLYLLPAESAQPPKDPGRVNPQSRLTLEHGLGELRWQPGAAEGLADDLVARGLELRYRHGGEKIKLVGQSHTRKLKKLLQEAGVVPWMRDRIPLVFADGELVAVADLWLAAGAASKPGVAVRWENRPPIH